MSFENNEPVDGSPDEPQTAAAIPRLTMRRLAISRYSVPGLGWVTRTLWRLTSDPRPGGELRVYAVELAGLGMRRLVVLGEDSQTARALYAALADCTVTPCALRDVLEELVDLPGK